MGIVRYLGKGSGLILLIIGMVVIFFTVLLVTLRSAKREFAGRIVVPVFFLEAAIIFLVILLNFPAKKQAGVGAGVVPMLWIIGISGFSILLLVKALIGSEEKDPKRGRIDVVLVSVGATILYLILIQYIGYFISSVLFLGGSMYYLTYRNWKVIAGVTAGWLLFSYFAFYKLLFVPLPTGTLLRWVFG